MLEDNLGHAPLLEAHVERPTPRPPMACSATRVPSIRSVTCSSRRSSWNVRLAGSLTVSIRRPMLMDAKRFRPADQPKELGPCFLGQPRLMLKLTSALTERPPGVHFDPSCARIPCCAHDLGEEQPSRRVIGLVAYELRSLRPGGFRRGLEHEAARSERREPMLEGSTGGSRVTQREGDRRLAFVRLLDQRPGKPQTDAPTFRCSRDQGHLEIVCHGSVAVPEPSDTRRSPGHQRVIPARACGSRTTTAGSRRALAGRAAPAPAQASSCPRSNR